MTLGGDAPLGDVHVTLAGQDVAQALGVQGALLAVEASKPQRASEPVSIAIDYTSFDRAGGADYAQRLKLVQLPACAVTTPAKPDCQTAVQLPTRNDYSTHRLSATAVVSPQGRAVIAATSDPSGVSSNAATTSLKPSGSWTTTGSTGGFSWSYPVTVPPAAAGKDVAPSVALSYSSADVDGRVAGTNAQSSWAGMGWEYSPGFIERTYRPCADDKTAGSRTTQDLCWGGQVVTMSLNGVSTPLVFDDVATNNGDGQTVRRWHAASDNLQRIKLVRAGPDGTNPSGYAGEYWQVTTTDGVQYYFGLNAVPGAAESTNATLKVPVYAPHGSDPCNSAGSCTQAWRWNLDYVVDPNHNATAYYYKTEPGYYGANNHNTSVAYDRGGYLTRIDYGLHVDGSSAYSHGIPEQISFSLGSRCFTGDCSVKADGTVAAANQVNWKDTPVDLLCPSTTCAQHSPSYFTLQRLSGITTSVKVGSTRQTVDSYAVRSSIHPGSTQLWLDGITRTASGGTGGNIALPETTFGYTDMDNRVAGYGTWPATPFGRLTRITAETGALTTVTYSNSPSGGPLAGGATAACDQFTFPAPDKVTAAQLQTNNHLCYPVYWTPPYQPEPQIGLAWKYVVTKVSVKDPEALTPTHVTKYGYDGDPAWKLDDTELVKPTNRTYSQFRGYSTVETTTGDPTSTSNGVADGQTLTTTTYFRGMNGPAVSDSRGDTIADDNALAGTTYEQRVFGGLSSTAELSTTITDPTMPVQQTGSRSRTASGISSPLVATRVTTARTRVLTDKLSTATTGDVTTKTDTNYFDTLGRVTKEQESGTGITALCKFTTYADNTSSWIRTLPSHVVQTAGACPAGATPTGTTLSDLSTLYDGSSASGAVPGAGNSTETDVVASAGDTAKVTSAYDSSGRVTTSTASDDSPASAPARATTMTYTPAVGGPLTATTIINALNQTSSTTVSADRSLPIVTTDVAGLATTNTYDALGRPLSTWLPNRDTSLTANVTHTYTLTQTAPLAVTTTQLVDTGTVYTGDGEYSVTNVSIADALGQVVQTQSDAENNNTLVADTTYDSHGWVVATGNWGTSGSPGTAPLDSGGQDAVHDRTQTTYDATGRAVLSAAYDGTHPVTGMTTTTIYGGDRTTTLPPTGGVASTAIADVNGKTLTNQQYTKAPTVAGTVVAGGAPDTTTYTYDPLGRMATLTDAGYGAATWSWTYDEAGRVTSASDPDTGTTATTYDDYGDAVTVTDASNTTLAYKYDGLGRKTLERLGSVTGAVQATWTYDTLQAGKLTSSTRKNNGYDYTVAVTGYTDLGQPTGTTTTLPAAAGTLAGPYTTLESYSKTGLLLTVDPAAGGGLPTETLHYSYTHQGRPLGLSSIKDGYTTATTYDAFGEVTQQTRSVTDQATTITNTWDPQSHRLTNVLISAATAPPQLDNTGFAYDPSGNVLAVTDTQGPAGSPVEKQCFRYDGLDRLVQAYTNAGATCIKSGAVTTADVTGTQPYWENWTFDSSGGQATVIRHATTAGGTDQSTAFTNGATTSINNGVITNQPHAHALASTTTTGGPNAGNQTYTYDPDGQTITGATSVGTVTNAWTPQHHLATSTTSNGTRTAQYDADGNLLLEQSPTASTAYLPGEELTLDAATSKITGTRYYPLAGSTIAVRVGANSAAFYLFGNDQHGTAQIAYQPAAQRLSRRQYDPYGYSIGNGVGVVWPESHGFLGAPTSALSALTHVGAREYDPATGRFISVDPVLDPTSPQQNNGYDYSRSNPVIFSDPTGLCVYGADRIENDCRYGNSTTEGDGYNAEHSESIIRQNSPITDDPTQLQHDFYAGSAFGPSHNYWHSYEGDHASCFGQAACLAAYQYITAHPDDPAGAKRIAASYCLGERYAQCAAEAASSDIYNQGAINVLGILLMAAPLGGLGSKAADAATDVSADADGASTGVIDDVPDPSPVYKANGAPDRSSPWYVSYRDPDGNLQTIGNSDAQHAEARIQQMYPGTPMSRPFGWRTVDGSSGPQWVVGTVCQSCQVYPRSLFPAGTRGAPGGPWGDGS